MADPRREQPQGARAFDSPGKDPAKVRAGTIGARARWGEHIPRVVRLDALTPEQRRLVAALVAAAKSSPEAVA